jgi:hypothetical protein
MIGQRWRQIIRLMDSRPRRGLSFVDRSIAGICGHSEELAPSTPLSRSCTDDLARQPAARKRRFRLAV